MLLITVYFGTQALTAHRYLHKTIGICGILLCISGRSAIDLGGIYWVMVATKIHFSRLHALSGSPDDRCQLLCHEYLG